MKFLIAPGRGSPQRIKVDRILFYKPVGDLIIKFYLIDGDPWVEWVARDVKYRDKTLRWVDRKMGRKWYHYIWVDLSDAMRALRHVFSLT